MGRVIHSATPALERLRQERRRSGDWKGGYSASGAVTQKTEALRNVIWRASPAQTVPTLASARLYPSGVNCHTLNCYRWTHPSLQQGLYPSEAQQVRLHNVQITPAHARPTYPSPWWRPLNILRGQLLAFQPPCFLVKLDSRAVFAWSLTMLPGS